MRCQNEFFAPVAQWSRALDYESRGREFESLQGRQEQCGMNLGLHLTIGVPSKAGILWDKRRRPNYLSPLSAPYMM